MMIRAMSGCGGRGSAPLGAGPDSAGKSLTYAKSAAPRRAVGDQVWTRGLSSPPPAGDFMSVVVMASIGSAVPAQASVVVVPPKGGHHHRHHFAAACGLCRWWIFGHRHPPTHRHW